MTYNKNQIFCTSTWIKTKVLVNATTRPTMVGVGVTFDLMVYCNLCCRVLYDEVLSFTISNVVDRLVCQTTLGMSFVSSINIKPSIICCSISILWVNCIIKLRHTRNEINLDNNISVHECHSYKKNNVIACDA